MNVEAQANINIDINDEDVVDNNIDMMHTARDNFVDDPDRFQRLL